MTIDVRPLSHAMGAEVTGVDLSKPLGDSQWHDIHAAWLKHIVLVFPGQKLTPAEQVAFGRRFGDLDDHREDPAYRLPDFPEIYLLGNFLIDGKLSKTKDVGRGWHTDHSYTNRPTKLSMLYCRAIPPVGGTTMFANTYLGYEALSDKLKGIVDDLEAVHDFSHRFLNPSDGKPNERGFAKMLEMVIRIRDKYPQIAHPLVRTHPETGRKALYLNEIVMTHLVGMSRDESQWLLQYLVKHAVRPEFTYRHTYKVDDLLFWDNRCSLHNALADYVHNPANLRKMHRLTVLGEKFGRVLEDSPGGREGGSKKADSIPAMA